MADTARVQAKKHDWFTCYANDKTKKVAFWKKIAAALNGKPDGAVLLLKHIATGPRVKLEERRPTRTQDPDTNDPNQLGGLAWTLTQ